MKETSQETERATGSQVESESAEHEHEETTSAPSSPAAQSAELRKAAKEGNAKEGAHEEGHEEESHEEEGEHDHDHDHDHGHGGAPHISPPAAEGDKKAGGPLSKEAALKVIQDAFGDYKTMSAGTVTILDTAGIKEAYDKIYGKTEYSWEKYVVAKLGGSLNGFAYGGVNYINKDSANTGTVPHEMLHNNIASDWRGVVGNQFDEGATDYLKQYALKKAGLTSPNSYPDQLSIVTKVVSIGVSEDCLFTAYLKGGAKELVADVVDKNCTGTWAEVKTACQAKDWAKAKAKLEKKS